MSSVRIKLSSTDISLLNDVCSQIKDIAERMKVKMKGPIPLPRKEMKVPVRKTPCGSGRETYETWEMRISKRFIDLAVNEMALRLIMRIPMPKGVNVEMEIRE
ncbi:MAG: 30S ribosomal protein S10 [Candidatus Nanoarchaeia archaeon]|nr:30S ribosomal protein S10 [Candidatus Nanoarchaeia archaeon]MDD5499753.1 30S ribosomal protein S10 [Candidatus Nanoarchaeia archaeon]